LFHSVTEAGTGIQVMDVWETKAQFEAFANDQSGPLTALLPRRRGSNFADGSLGHCRG